MDQLKFALGPYEIFAGIIGGSPLVFAVFLIFNPAGSLQELFLIFKANLTTLLILLGAFFSYILAGSIQSLSWKYFAFVCDRLGRSYFYFGDMIMQKHAQLPVDKPLGAIADMEFEERLVLLLRDRIGIPKQQRWLDDRLASYLKAIGSQAPASAELHLANHIMYRNLSLGFILLAVAFLINLLRMQSSLLNQLIFMALLLFMAYTAFFRALSFKKWHNRELLMGFYFSTCQ
ncbi:MAG: hypothetical protein AAGH67_19270 [Cyanobacteria bacterium P01_H01_bin.162]